MWLKQNTAVTIQVGPFVDDTDGATPEESLTILASDIRLSKNGADMASSSATVIGHDENGFYRITLSATDVNTLGLLTGSIKVAGALSVYFEYIILPNGVYNSLIINSGNLKVDVISFDQQGLQSGLWSLIGKKISLYNTTNGEAAFRAEAAGASANGAEFIGTNKDIDANELDNIKTDTGNIAAKLPVTGLIASQDSVDAIENTTRIQISIASAFVIPETGDSIKRIRVFLKDTTGNPEDPDNNELSLQIRANNGGVYKIALFDDEAGTTPATVSTTFTPSYYKMNRLGVGDYELFYKLPSTEVIDSWSLTFTYEENTVINSYGRGVNVTTEVIGSAILADNSTNYGIISKSLKLYDASGDTAVNNSVYKDIKDDTEAVVNKLPSGTISDYNTNTLVTGSVTVGQLNKFMKAMFNGRIRKDFPNQGDFTIYDDDNVTILTVVNSTVLERTKVS